ncbi:MAG: substrate-binding domain-containing protein [Pseudomonadota bacterium]
MRRFAILLLAAVAVPLTAAPLPECAADATAARAPSSQGDAAMRPVMDALLTLWRQKNPSSAAPTRWQHQTDATAAGTLMFEVADMAPITRPFFATELAPYDHQFRGDMIKAPTMVKIATVNGRPAWIAVNRRPDSPLPARTYAFLKLALSPEGQAAIGRVPGFAAIPDAAAQLAVLDTYVAPLDPALPTYRPVAGLSGSIRSDGSDGMKALMDSWQCRFAALQPGTPKGERWEHLGTLNGFHALLVGEAEIAPMGREIWPQELAQWRSAFGTNSAPVEIAVARGGFNTPQRTTAQAIFVHPSNPLASLSVKQLAAIFGANPTITRWGQLGLTGEWADKPIRVLTPPLITPNAMSMQMMVLNGGSWNTAAVAAPYADTAKALLADPTAIGFGGLEEGAPGLKSLAVAGADGVPVPMTAENAANGRYPLTRLMFIRLAPGQATPVVKQFLRFILSRDGQERVRYSGYFPLTAKQAAAELAKLDR